MNNFFSEHIKHIIEEAELEESSVVRNFRTTASDGKSEGSVLYDKIGQLKLPASDENNRKFQFFFKRFKVYIIDDFLYLIQYNYIDG